MQKTMKVSKIVCPYHGTYEVIAINLDDATESAEKYAIYHLYHENGKRHKKKLDEVQYLCEALRKIARLVDF